MNTFNRTPFEGGDEMLERDVEKALVRQVRQRGGIAFKFVSPGYDGVPDRLVLLPKGKLAFVELKAPRMKMRALQLKRKEQLEALGHLVYCLDDINQIGGVLDEIQST